MAEGGHAQVDRGVAAGGLDHRVVDGARPRCDQPSARRTSALRPAAGARSATGRSSACASAGASFALLGHGQEAQPAEVDREAARRVVPASARGRRAAPCRRRPARSGDRTSGRAHALSGRAPVALSASRGRGRRRCAPWQPRRARAAASRAAARRTPGRSRVAQDADAAQPAHRLMCTGAGAPAPTREHRLRDALGVEADAREQLVALAVGHELLGQGQPQRSAWCRRSLRARHWMHCVAEAARPARSPRW